MNLKKKLKNFFTLKHNANDGFTLVELIVVVAILGVLGGVGVPAYSGYVKKANMGADQSLVGEVIQALELGYYSGTLTEPGYVILYAEDDADCDGKAVNTTNEVDKVMVAAFGEDWETTLRLKYDDWTDTGLLTEAANNAYATSVPGSTYIAEIGTEKVLGDVQNCATKFSQFLKSYNDGDTDAAVEALEERLGTDVVNGILTEAGYGDGDYSDLTADELANLTVFGVAQNVCNDTASQQAIVESFAGGSPLTNEVTVNSSLVEVANWYAATEALVAYLDDPTCTEAFNNINMNGNATEIAVSMMNAQTAINNRIENADDTNATDMKMLTNLQNYYYVPGADGKTLAQKDGEAYVGVMSTVHNLREDYTKDEAAMKDESLFTSGDISDRVDGFVAATEMITYMGGDIANVLNGIAGSAVVVFANTDGRAIAVKVISDAADPRG